MTADDPTHGASPVGPTAVQVYDKLVKSCRNRVRQLTTVQFDPETGIQRHFFNGKLERTVHVRGIRRIHPT